MALHNQSGNGKSGVLTGAPRSPLEYNSFYYLHKVICLKSLPVAGNSRFASHLALHFPEAAARINEYDFGVLHLEVGALKLATRDAIAQRDWDTVASHFAFVSEMLADGGPELRDALRVSYLGNLFYGETTLNYAKARSLLPRGLGAALADIESHYESLVR